MALNGNLGFVPLDEILRLLARSDQKGCVSVRGDDLSGRIFVTKKGVALATTTDDRALRERLINSGCVDHDYLRTVESGQATLAPLTESDPSIIDLIREISVESLYHMARKGDSFEVDEETESPYASPKAFDLEALLSDSHRRSDEWSEVNRILPDMDAVIRMNRDLGDRDEVTLGRDAWRVLSELDGGSSVRDMAKRLGTTEFWTAKVAASLADSGLLLTPPEAPAEPEVVDSWSAAEKAETGEAVDPNQSWWSEPADAAKNAAEAEDAAHENVPVADSEVEEAEQTDQGGRLLGSYAQRRNGSDVFVSDSEYDHSLESVEEDTEAFLEKVFSELESAEPAESEGFGLLRRRRLAGGFGDSDES